MATRFYLNTRGQPRVRPSVGAGWENSNVALDVWRSRREMYTWHNGSEELSPFGIDNQAAVHDLLMAQFISEPLSAQTISGTIRAVVQASESNSAANMRSQMHAWVMAPDGSVRGTLTTFTTGALASEWSTTVTSRYFPVGSTGTTVTSVTASAGDRIVVELGARVHDTTATVYNGRLRLGDNHFSSPGTSWDLPSDQTNTTTTRNGWIEFSANLTFQTAEVAISDSIAGAPDCMPAAEGKVIARVANASTFTTEADDPTSMGSVSYSADHGFTGWVKLVGPAGGARVKIEVGGGLGIQPFAFVFASSPTAGSSYESYKESVDFSTGDIFTDVPAGVTKYVCVMPGDGSFEDFGSGDTNMQLFFTRAKAGGISNTIADAPDMLPAVQDSWEYALQTDYDFFTTETDDPTWFSTEYGALWYTGWTKLVVPSSGIKVNIDTYLPIDYADGPIDILLAVFDEVPTATSVPIAYADFTPDASPPAGSIDQNWSGKGKIPDLVLDSGTTYYVGVVPLTGTDWPLTEGVNIQIAVYRHLDSGTTETDDFSVEAIVQRITQPPIFIDGPVFVDSATATAVAGSNSILVDVPPGVQQGDLLLAVVGGDVTTTSLISVTPIETLRPGEPSRWTAFDHDSVSTALHVHRAFYRFADDPDASYEFQIRVGSTLVQTGAKVAAILAFRNASVPILRTSNAVDTVSSGTKVTPSWFTTSADPNFGATISVVGVWAGGASTTSTWTPIGDVTERVDIGVSNANMFIGTWSEVLDGFQDSRGATPSQPEFNMAQVVQIMGRTTTLGLSAFINGYSVGINAYLIEPGIATQHDRTRYHFDMTPAHNVYTTSALGTNAAGSSLHEVLADLDSMISDLESGNS
jgi:hypothetical protein